MADVTFDGTAKLIIVNNGITELDAKDVYSWWKQWVIGEGYGYPTHSANFLPAFSTTGGDPVSPTASISAYFFLINGWRIRPFEGDHFLRIIGNLYAEGGVDSPIVPTLGNYNVLARSEVSPQSQTVTTGGGVGTPAEVADAVWDAGTIAHDDAGSFGEALQDIPTNVWREKINEFLPQTVGAGFQVLLYGDYIFVDGNSAYSGTGTFGLGTKARPLNNINDAVVVADSRNIKKLMILSDITIEAGDDISNKAIETIGTMDINVTLAADCTCNAAIFRYLNIEGEISNGDIIQIENCSVGNLERFTGIMNNVAFGQGAEISLGYWATIIQATAGGDPTNEPEVNIGTADLNMSHYSGNLKLMGKTGSNRTVVNASSLNVIIDPTCVAGTIQLLGVGVVDTDNSGAGCNVDTDGFISVENIAHYVWDEHLLDHITAGSAGALLVTIQSDIKRTLGLMHENVYIDDATYDEFGNLVDARVRIYSDSVSVGTSNNVIETYRITADGPECGKFTFWKQTVGL